MKRGVLTSGFIICLVASVSAQDTLTIHHLDVGTGDATLLVMPTSPRQTPEEDWGRFTKDFEVEDPAGWKEYERKFWKEYNKTINASGKNGEFDKTKEPKEQPNIFVDVDHSLCIGCCSCETIAPQVFQVDKISRMNPKSSVINQKGARFNKIMDAAKTCPTKAISVDDVDTKRRLFPF